MRAARRVEASARRASAVCGLLLVSGLLASAQTAPSREYQVKAVFLFNFAQFVEWPLSAFASTTSPIVIGVLGENPFGGYLDETVRGEIVDNRPLEVQRYSRVDEIKICHVLFISRSETAVWRRFSPRSRTEASSSSVTAMTSSQRGGMIRLATAQNKIRLIISLESRQSGKSHDQLEAPAIGRNRRGAEEIAMAFKDAPIKRKLTALFVLTSGAVVALTCLAYIAFEFLTFRQTLLEQLSTLGKVVAANSTAAVAFENERDAGEILAALRAEPHIVAAGLYDRDGKLFSRYPGNLLAGRAFPSAPGGDGYALRSSYVAGFQPVARGQQQTAGHALSQVGSGSDVRAVLAVWRHRRRRGACVAAGGVHGVNRAPAADFASPSWPWPPPPTRSRTGATTPCAPPRRPTTSWAC